MCICLEVEKSFGQAQLPKLWPDGKTETRIILAHCTALLLVLLPWLGFKVHLTDVCLPLPGMGNIYFLFLGGVGTLVYLACKYAACIVPSYYVPN